MLRLKSEGKKPIDEKTYEEKLHWENQSSGVHKRKIKKILIVAAAVCVMLLGATINVVARNGHKAMAYPSVKNRNVLLRYNTSTEVLNDSLDNAYNEISEKLDIPVLTLFYLPEEMSFYDFASDSAHAFIRFQYKRKMLVFKRK